MKNFIATIFFLFKQIQLWPNVGAVCLQVFVQLNLWHADKIIYAGAKEQISSMRIDISSLDQFFKKNDGYGPTIGITISNNNNMYCI